MLVQINTVFTILMLLLVLMDIFTTVVDQCEDLSVLVFVSVDSR